MLLYNNRSFFRVVLACYGSIFFDATNMGMGLFIAGIAALLQYFIDQDASYKVDIDHHYGLHALGTIVGFSVVFRTNLGWSRYWEAVSALHLMYSKWGDAFSQLFAFASVSVERAKALGTTAGDEKAKRVEAALEMAFRHFILCSALAADRLTHGDTSRMEQRSSMSAPWSQRLVRREELRSKDLTGATCMPELRPVAKLGSGGSSHRPSDMAKDKDFQNNWKGSYLVRAMPTPRELDALELCSDRTSVVMYWIVHSLAKISTDLDAAPPIQSRMYQELSNGMLGFNQAVKLADVPFPFPYAQMLTLLLACYSCFIPVYMVAFTQSMIAGPIMSFALFQGIWGLNETAKELENPFGTDVNDITLSDFHLRFVDCCQEVYEAHCLAGNHTPHEPYDFQRGTTAQSSIPTQDTLKKAESPSLTPRQSEPVASMVPMPQTLGAAGRHENSVDQRDGQPPQVLSNVRAATRPVRNVREGVRADRDPPRIGLHADMGVQDRIQDHEALSTSEYDKAYDMASDMAPRANTIDTESSREIGRAHV